MAGIPSMKIIKYEKTLLANSGFSKLSKCSKSPGERLQLTEFSSFGTEHKDDNFVLLYYLYVWILKLQITCVS